MSRKVLKGAVLATVLGSVFQFGSCLGSDLWRAGLLQTAAYTSLEFLLDNNQVMDLFTDGGATQIAG